MKITTGIVVGILLSLSAVAMANQNQNSVGKYSIDGARGGGGFPVKDFRHVAGSYKVEQGSDGSGVSELGGGGGNGTAFHYDEAGFEQLPSGKWVQVYEKVMAAEQLQVVIADGGSGQKK